MENELEKAPLIRISEGVEVEWRRAPSATGQPLDSHFLDLPDGTGWAVFPELHGHGWDVCWHDVDSGFDFEDWTPSLRAGKAMAERKARANAMFVAERARYLRAAEQVTNE